MRIYVPEVVEGQEWILCRYADDYDLFNQLGGRQQSGWDPPQMYFLREKEDGAGRRYSDFPWHGEHVLILRSRALELLRPDLEPYGEFLPLRADETVSLFNVTTVVDALDEERSQIVRFDDGGVLTIEKHVFRPDAIGDAQIFKLPERHDGVRVSSIYLQETIVRRIGELGLKGVAFDMVWSDEDIRAGEETSVEYPCGEPISVPRSRWRAIGDLLGLGKRH